ncbi:MAG: DUF3160 domain-containing protein [Kiritimatiellales bacterium]
MTRTVIQALLCLLFIFPMLGKTEESFQIQWQRQQELFRNECLKDWHSQTNLAGLTASDQDKLEENRILVANESYRQIFEAYQENNAHPFFITSDSLLNAYHVLYEESIRRMELQLAAKGPEILSVMLKNIEPLDKQLKGNSKLASAAKHRAKLVLGIGLRLMDENFRFGDKTLDPLLNDEVKRIEKASGIFRPDWLGDSPVQTLDYSRYQPRGFYTQTESLTRYFRAVAWLQSIPFRLNSDEEFLSILMMSNSLYRKHFSNRAEQEHYTRFFDAHSLFIGLQDDWSLVTQIDLERYGNGDFTWNLTGEWFNKRIRERYLESYANRPLINDQIIDNAIGPNYRIISAYRTPASVLFQRTTDIRQFNRPYPTGLEVATALGSDFVRQTLKDPQKEKLLKTIDSSRQYFQSTISQRVFGVSQSSFGKSLYFQYLETLQLLLDKPEPDAPDFMFKPAWEIKSCNTVLGGWAQLRSTWILHSKQTALCLGIHNMPPGFVEPDPEFFGQMAELVRNTRETLDRSGAFDYSDEQKSKAFSFSQIEQDFDVESLWEQLDDACRQLQIIAHKQLRGAEFNPMETRFIKGYGKTLKQIMLHFDDIPAHDNAPRIGDVFSNPNSGGYLHVGIGRPQKLYVLYPWKGNDVLCEGAVMPYFELVRDERLSRDQWKDLLDSDEKPTCPQWFRPLEAE